MPLRPEDLPRDVDKLVDLAVRLSAENEHLREMVKSVNGFAFGARSERGEAIIAGQGLLDLGDLETNVVGVANDDEPVVGTTSSRKSAKRNIGALPKHLERVERIIEPAVTDCPCCAGALHRIGEDASEAFDWVPAILRVIRTVRPRYACRQCQSAIVQAPAPKRMIEGGMTTTSTIAWIATARFAWSIPLNRQLQMLAGQGLVLDRSLFSGWMKRAAWWLEGLYELQMRVIHAQPRVFVDETRMPVLEKGRKKVRISQFWAHACDDSGWNGPAPPAVCFVFAKGRGYREIRDQLAQYQGLLQVDGYAAYKSLEKARGLTRPVRLAFCLAHARRKFVDVHKTTKSPVSAQIIALIAEIYGVEARVRGTCADTRHAARQAESVPLVAQIRVVLEATLPQLSTKSSLAKAIRYMLAHWRGLWHFLDDGRLEADTNTVERNMRTVAQGRKSSLFAGSEDGARTWAVLSSLLQTARLNGLDPYTWLNDVLERIVSGAVKNNQLEQLLAWNWKPADGSAMRLAA